MSNVVNFRIKVRTKSMLSIISSKENCFVTYNIMYADNIIREILYSQTSLYWHSTDSLKQQSEWNDS